MPQNPFLKPNSALTEAGCFDSKVLIALQAMWITTVEQFLGRSTPGSALEGMAQDLGVGREQVAIWREACLDLLTSEDRERLCSAMPGLFPRPGMGLKLPEGRPKATQADPSKSEEGS